MNANPVIPGNEHPNCPAPRGPAAVPDHPYVPTNMHLMQELAKRFGLVWSKGGGPLTWTIVFENTAGFRCEVSDYETDADVLKLLRAIMGEVVKAEMRSIA